jgi:hypothetical protein
MDLSRLNKDHSMPHQEGGNQVVESGKMMKDFKKAYLQMVSESKYEENMY